MVENLVKNPESLKKSTVEDVLARRLRALFLNAPAALRAAPRVAGLLAFELGRDDAWKASQLQDFNAVAQHYLV